MRKKAPRQASLDEVRITREGGIAVIEHADPNVSVSRVSIGPLLKTMSDAAVLGLFNGMIEAQEKIAAGYDRVAVEIPPGRPQISFSESSGQWVPRGRILRCQIEDDEGGETTVYIDDRKLDLGEFGRLLNFYAGWGMRIAFVPADEVTEQPEIEVRDPPLEDEKPGIDGVVVAATMATREPRRGSESLQSSCRSMDWLARDGLRADRHERYVQPLYEPWAICSLESQSTYRARPGCDDLPSSREWMTRVRLSFEWSQLRWCQVLVDRSAAANDTRGFASRWRPIRCPDR